MHETEQEVPIVHGVLQGAVVQATVHVLEPELWGLLQNPLLQSCHCSV
jgi:hypothetical protein